MTDKQAREDIEWLKKNYAYKCEVQFLETRVTELENNLKALLKHFSLKPTKFPARLEMKIDE